LGIRRCGVFSAAAANVIVETDVMAAKLDARDSPKVAPSSGAPPPVDTPARMMRAGEHR
jgi:hypothetical protein